MKIDAMKAALIVVGVAALAYLAVVGLKLVGIAILIARMSS